MAENGIKQVDIGKVLDKSKTTVNQNLNGTGGDFSMEDVRKICRKYEISSDAYFIAQRVS